MAATLAPYPTPSLRGHVKPFNELFVILSSSRMLPVARATGRPPLPDGGTVRARGQEGETAASMIGRDSSGALPAG